MLQWPSPFQVMAWQLAPFQHQAIYLKSWINAEINYKGFFFYKINRMNILCQWNAFGNIFGNFQLILSRGQRDILISSPNWKKSEKIAFHITVINSLWPRNATWWHISGSTLGQVRACCLMAPSHYLNPFDAETRIFWNDYGVGHNYMAPYYESPGHQ